MGEFVLEFEKGIEEVSNFEKKILTFILFEKQGERKKRNVPSVCLLPQVPDSQD